MAIFSAKHLHKTHGKINKYNKIKQPLILEIFTAKLYNIYNKFGKRKFDRIAV